MINTENIELQTAKEIVTAGLTKAAESLSFFYERAHLAGWREF